MRKGWPFARCGLTSAACWLLFLSADTLAQRVDAVAEHRRDTSRSSSAAAIVDAASERGRLNINVAAWPSSSTAPREKVSPSKATRPSCAPLLPCHG